MKLSGKINGNLSVIHLTNIATTKRTKMTVKMQERRGVQAAARG